MSTKPSRYADWPEVVRSLYDQAIDGSDEARSALVAMFDNPGSEMEQLSVIDALTDLGGPEMQAEMRKGIRQAFGDDARGLVPILLDMLKSPNLSDSDRAEIEKLMSQLPTPSTKA